MEIILLESALEDRDYWIKTHNTKIMKRISMLLDDILAHPFMGIGKPEPLKGKNFFDKPNEQSQACLSYAMARKSRTTSNFFTLLNASF